MAKHHFVPRLIIKRFADSDGKILFYNKNKNSFSKPIPHYDQLQEGNFYSKKSLSELKSTFKHITINPLFKDIEKTLEENLSINVESPMGAILERIIQPLLEGKDVKLSSEKLNFIKKYIEIQHVRTVKFKEIGKEVHKVSLMLPSNIKDTIKGIENNRVINPVELVKNNAPHLNSKARRQKVKQLKKLLKNPDFLKGIRESDRSNSMMDEEIKKVEKQLEDIRTHPDKHSSEIIDVGLTDRFLKSRKLDKNNLRFVINNTSIPFVLTDVGIVIMCWEYEDRQELRVYLPIHPRILIELSPEEDIFIANEKYVKEFNKISKDESLLKVYSNSAEALGLLVK